MLKQEKTALSQLVLVHISEFRSATVD